MAGEAKGMGLRTQGFIDSTLMNQPRDAGRAFLLVKTTVLPG
jgi:hypothetical protein